MWYTPYDLFCPARYRDVVNHGFFKASAALVAAKVITRPAHYASTAKFPVGTTLRPKGWAVQCGVDSKGQPLFAGGYATKYSLSLVVDPSRGELNKTAADFDCPHEWGHVLLYGAGIDDTKHHEILAKAGL